MRVRTLSSLALLASLAGVGCADLPSVQPLCGQVEPMTLLAQSGPNAEELPCMEVVPFGFEATTFDVGSHEAVWHLSHEVAGRDVVRVRLARECRSFDADRASLEVGPAGGDWVRNVVEDGEAYRADWVRRDEHACVTVTYDVDHPDWRKVLDEFEPAFRLVERERVAQALFEETEGRLRLPLREAAAEGS